ncbi:Protein of unknown function [Paraburkholderia fungorum]|uniref:DUF1488 domain-containing protein n=1 Tax=Paraburkholderia fungorum TaxID=134537 RepID=A0A1H1K0S3_9BURK|nr:Protein of unknown function [Paraburkholderia fungorum]
MTFTLIVQGRDIACAVTRDALERHLLNQREADDAALVSAFERGRRQILDAAERKNQAVESARILLTAGDLGEP